MISNYEIRENSLTPNSVFILLIKADEQGREDVERELSEFCKPIEADIDGFDYVFELSGITDDYMLEKIRGRLEFISSSVLGISQTFGNKNKTETINIEKTMTMGSAKIDKTKHNFENTKTDGAYTKRGKENTVNLSDSGFSVTNEEKTQMTFRDIKADSSLVSGDEKGIELMGDTSLKIMQTIPNIKREEPSQDFVQEEPSVQENVPQENIIEQNKLSTIEEENKTIQAYSQTEMKNVSISMEKEKTGLFGTIFSKIKSAMHPKQNHQEIKNKKAPSEERSALSELLRTKTSNGQKQEQPVQQAKTPSAQEENPFQDLGSGIIVKKGVLEEETIPTNATKRELSANPVTAKLQVDDIFAAETVCDLYDNPQEGKKQNEESFYSDKETPLDRLEKAPSSQKEELDESLFGDRAASKTQPASMTKKETQDELFANIDKRANETSNDTVTLPDKIFTKGDIKRDQHVIPPSKETPITNKVVQNEQSLHNLKQEKSAPQVPSSGQINNQVKESQEEQQTNSYSLPNLEKLENVNHNPVNKEIRREENINTQQEKMPEIQTNNLHKTKVTEIKPEVKQNIPQMKPIIKKEETIMQESNKTKHTIQQTTQHATQHATQRTTQPVTRHTTQHAVQQSTQHTTQQQNLKTTHKVGATTSAGKTRAKIDHTLHVATPTKDAKYRNYPIEMPLIPTYTFANMDISAIRFAHAMAMATLDDLGKSNNPFLLQGLSGTGKTHFLHAIGYEISKKIPQSKILFTNGVRFSRGVQYLLEKGQKDKLDEFFNNAEVLIIDDVHLTAVNEHNREYISKVLNDFLKNKKQIILSSKYPPESLKRFEELVNFKFSLGTIAELKVPSKAHFGRLTNKIVTSSFLDLTEQQVQAFFTDQSHSLGDVSRNVKRVKVLFRRIESSGIKKMSYEDILKEMTAFNGENNESEIVKKDFADITALEKNKENSWGNFGFFFPTAHIDKFRWVAFAFQEAAKELGIQGGFNYALKSAYSTEHIISAAFKIANICDLKGLKGAIILGPSFMECKEPIRDNFYDILTHMLEVMMIRCGTINFEDIKKPSAYIKMLGDILK